MSYAAVELVGDERLEGRLRACRDGESAVEVPVLHAVVAEHEVASHEEAFLLLFVVEVALIVVSIENQVALERFDVLEVDHLCLCAHCQAEGSQRVEILFHKRYC